MSFFAFLSQLDYYSFTSELCAFCFAQREKHGPGLPGRDLAQAWSHPVLKIESVFWPAKACELCSFCFTQRERRGLGLLDTDWV